MNARYDQLVKVLIGKREIEAIIEEDHTFMSEDGIVLRELTISFVIRGRDAQEKYGDLEYEARQKGLLSNESDSARNLRWAVHDTLCQWCARSGGTEHYYKAHWKVRHQEAEESDSAMPN